MNKELDNNRTDQNENTDRNIEWDNGEATYGHTISDSEFKRKNTPSKDHISNTENETNTIDNLKNENLSQGEDIGSRNSIDEKGLGGKDL